MKVIAAVSISSWDILKEVCQLVRLKPSGEAWVLYLIPSSVLCLKIYDMKSALSVFFNIRRLAASAPKESACSRCLSISLGTHAMAAFTRAEGSLRISFINVNVFSVVKTVSSQGWSSPVSSPPKDSPNARSPMMSAVR